MKKINSDILFLRERPKTWSGHHRDSSISSSIALDLRDNHIYNEVSVLNFNCIVTSAAVGINHCKRVGSHIQVVYWARNSCKKSYNMFTNTLDLQQEFVVNKCINIFFFFVWLSKHTVSIKLIRVWSLSSCSNGGYTSLVTTHDMNDRDCHWKLGWGGHIDVAAGCAALRILYINCTATRNDGLNWRASECSVGCSENIMRKS